MGFTLVMPFLPLYFRQLGVTNVGELALWSGLSLGATPALTAFLAPVWGAVADRFGRKIMVERALLSFVVVMAATAYVTAPWHVLALRCVQGLFAGYGALALAMAVDSAREGGVARAIGVVQTAQRLGPAIGPVVGGAVAQIVGLRRAFLVAAAFYGLAFLLVLTLYHEPGERAIARDGREPRPGFRALLRLENLKLLVLVVFGLQFIDRSFGPVLPLFVGEVGAPPARVALISGVLFSTAAAAGALGHHVAGRLLDRWSERRVMAASAGLGTGSLLLLALAGHVALLFVATPLFGLAIGIATTAAYASASRVIPAASRGAGFGLLSSASLAGLALSPMLSGLIAMASIRAVFVLDAVALVTLGAVVGRRGSEGEGIGGGGLTGGGRASAGEGRGTVAGE